MYRTVYSTDTYIRKAKEIGLNKIFKLIPVNFSWYDRKGNILGCNQNTIDFLGVNSFKDLIGKPLEDFCNPISVINTRKVLETGKSVEFEEEHHNLDGTITYFLSIKTPIKSCMGEILGVVNIALDITDRKLREFELFEAKKLAEEANIAKSEFLLNMQHDLRTPFSGILSVSELLEEKESDPSKREFLKDIKESSTLLLNLLNEILDHTREYNQKDNIRESIVDIHTILDDVRKIMIPELKSKGLYFNLIIPPGCVPSDLIGDAGKIKRLLLTVIANAVKFTEKGGVNVIVGYERLSKTHGEIYIMIADTGIGMPEDKIGTIFDPFVRLNPSYEGVYSGAGLGLSIVKSFLEAMGGRYEVKSKLGEGTIFYMWIPCKVS